MFIGYYSFNSLQKLHLVYICSKRQPVEADRSILELLNKLMRPCRQPGEENESESTNYNCTYNLPPDLFHLQSLSLLCILLITKGCTPVVFIYTDKIGCMVYSVLFAFNGTKDECLP